jgi:hypothetical protein
MHILMFLKQFQVKTDFAMEMDLFHINEQVFCQLEKQKTEFD